MSADLIHAPPPLAVDGLLGVPMDIQQVVATLKFDVQARVATAQATMSFTVGPVSGNAAFDLRQTIASAKLDGVPIAPAQLAHHDLGGGADARMRLISSSLAAGTAHTLALTYALGTPDAPGARPIGWDPAAPRLSFDLWMSDLSPGRYLEMWLPANLIFDRFGLDLEVQIVGSAGDHGLWTNGAVSPVAPDHWHILFPATFTALSPMLVVLPAAQTQTRTGSVVLPSSAAPVTIELVKRTSNPVNLAAIETQLAGAMAANVASTGPYVHGTRFVAWLWDEPGRSMEYDGATTSNPPALTHETFHSWWGRGVKPATQDDGWIDEAWTTYMTGGGAPQPFSAGEPPVRLAPDNPYARVTPLASYAQGQRFFGGLAAALGEPALRSAMAAFYDQHQGQLVTTADLQAWLIARTGVIEIGHWFHRWVYGHATPPAGAQPDLALLDAIGDPGADPFTGTVFWNSPDVWTRLVDDGAPAHQNAEFGQDNWLYARVHNRGAGTARSFVVTWNVRPWAGTEFVYPHDFLPCVAAAVGFALEPGQTRVLRARWPRASVPAAGTHACILASVSTTGDVAAAGRRVWEANDLAQRNLTIVDVAPNDTVVVDFELGSLRRVEAFAGVLELRRPARHPGLGAVLVGAKLGARPVDEPAAARDGERLAEMGAQVGLLASTAVEIGWPAAGAAIVRARPAAGSSLFAPTAVATAARESPQHAGQPAIVARRAGGEVRFPPAGVARIPVALAARTPLRLGLRLTAPRDARSGEELDVHLIQRGDHGEARGGITVRLRIS